MHGDFSRWTFESDDNYRAVLLQQGRALLDADWNEQTQITAYHDEIRTRDFLGFSAGPPENAAFKVTASDDGSWDGMRVSAGRYYVDGILVTVPEEKKLSTLIGGAPDDSCDLWVEVFARSESAKANPRLLDKALGELDTSVRMKTEWRLTTKPTQGEAPLMQAWINGQVGKPSPVGNWLYRVEVHQVEADGNMATLRWWRDNGSAADNADGKPLGEVRWPAATAPVELENGVAIDFEVVDRAFTDGDSWLIPYRSNGVVDAIIDWPKVGEKSNEKSKFMPPIGGAERHTARLARLVKGIDGKWSSAGVRHFISPIGVRCESQVLQSVNVGGEAISNGGHISSLKGNIEISLGFDPGLPLVLNEHANSAPVALLFESTNDNSRTIVFKLKPSEPSEPGRILLKTSNENMNYGEEATYILTLHLDWLWGTAGTADAGGGVGAPSHSYWFTTSKS